jgi:hypothetical protein
LKTGEVHIHFYKKLREFQGQYKACTYSVSFPRGACPRVKAGRPVTLLSPVEAASEPRIPEITRVKSLWIPISMRRYWNSNCENPARTQTFLWGNLDAPQLSTNAREFIAKGGNEIFLSAASAWEIAIKAAEGRLIYQSHRINTWPIAGVQF